MPRKASMATLKSSFRDRYQRNVFFQVMDVILLTGRVWAQPREFSWPPPRFFQQKDSEGRSIQEEQEHRGGTRQTLTTSELYGQRWSSENRRQPQIREERRRIQFWTFLEYYYGCNGGSNYEIGLREDESKGDIISKKLFGNIHHAVCDTETNPCQQLQLLKFNKKNKYLRVFKIFS